MHGFQHAESVGRGHLYVGQHQIEAAVGDQFGGVFGILAALGGDPRPATHRGGHLQLQRIVVDQQHPQSRLRRLRLPDLLHRRGPGLPDGHRHDEFAPLAETAFERNGPLEQLHESIDDRQPQSEPIDALRRTQAHELPENPLFLLTADAAARIADREDQPPLPNVGAKRHGALVGEFQSVGNQIVGDLPDVESVSRHRPRGVRTGFQTQFQPFGRGRGGKSRPDRFEQLRGAESHPGHLDLVDVQPVEIQQAVDQRQQVFGGVLHIVQVKFLPLVVGQPRQQVDIAHHRP